VLLKRTIASTFLIPFIRINRMYKMVYTVKIEFCSDPTNTGSVARYVKNYQGGATGGLGVISCHSPNKKAVITLISA